MIDKEKVKLVIATLPAVGTSPIRLSDFEKLDLQISGSSLSLGPNSIVNHLLRYIAQDLSNILIIINKLDWEREMWIRGYLSDTAWLYFAGSDIDMFHVELRSICDYVAEIIQAQSSHPSNVPRSFEKLRNSLAEEEEEKESKLHANIGEGLAKLVLNCNWFKEIRDVRDSSIHTGARIVVFLEKPKIQFQIYQGWSKKVNKEELMDNENVVNFEAYSALYVCYLLAFLDEFGSLLIVRYSIPRFEMKGGHENTGFQILRKWAERLVQVTD